MATEVALERETEHDYKLNNQRIAIFARLLERIANNHKITVIRSFHPGILGTIEFTVDGEGQAKSSSLNIRARTFKEDAPETVTFIADAGNGGVGKSFIVNSPDEVTDELLSRMIKHELSRSRGSGRSR